MKQSNKQQVWKQTDYQQNKEYFREKFRKRRIEHKQWFLSIKKDKSCIRCGESNIRCLDFHHIDPTIKYQEVSRMVASVRSKKLILEEISKCIILCSNCHRKEHSNLGVV